VFRQTLRPTQPSVQWVSAVLSPGVKHGRSVTLTTDHLVPRSEVPKLYGPPPGGRCWSSGGARVVCMRDIFILNEIWAQHKTYILVGTFTYHLLLVPVLAAFYKQHILSPARLRKVCYPLPEIYVKSVCRIYSGGGGVKSMKYLKGARTIKFWEPLA
jgi:hypothetical protein